MSIDLSQFIPTFLEESFEGLEIMESSLLDLHQGDSETINAIFRAAHSIKGGAGTFGFNQVTDFTHLVETLLDEMRDGRRAVSPTLVTLLLSSVDCIRLLIEAARDGVECQSDQVDEVKLQLQQVLSQLDTPLTAGNDDAEVAETPEAAPEADDAAGDEAWVIQFVPHQTMLQTGNDPILYFSALAELGPLTVELMPLELPELAATNPVNCLLSWQLTLETDVDQDEIAEIFEWVEDECDLTIERRAPAMSQPAPAVATTDPVSDEPEAQASDVEQAAPDERPSEPPVAEERRTAERRTAERRSAAKPAAAEGTSIRVGIDKVDGVINRVGELVITQAMLAQIGAELADEEHPAVDKLIQGLAQLERNTRDLQEDVMRIRMLPISFVFNRFPRLVHDISQQLGKEVELRLSGEQTELDKTVMEKIGDPLVHLVRNSLDHGLETPEERIAAGKPAKGVVELKAYHQGGFIVIEISDDGRGLNTAKIRERALDKGLISPDQQLTDAEIHQLIFQPGFSTADAVSDLSGRGVGMDVVRRNIESLGGEVSLASTAGQGSTLTVHLPLTLAILDGQLVQVGSETYVVPLISIVESVQIAESQVNAIGGQASLYHFRDEYIPLLNVRRLFGLPGDIRTQDEKMMIIVENAGQKYGLVVDELLAQQQVVLKSLESNFMPVTGISGATILGDGSVALIIDIKGLDRLNQQSADGAESTTVTLTKEAL